MILIGMAAARRAMRRHQDVPPPRATRLPLWRLVLGEAAWAVRQLVGEPRVLAALLLGVAATLAVLDAAAPGPVLPWPGRTLLALLAGLVVARGASARVHRRSTPASPGDDGAGPGPGIAVTEVVAALAGMVLLGWLATWLVTVLV